MLTFVSPWLFGVAMAAALGVVGLHLLSVRTPPALMLPTARFVPDGEARAVARQPRLNDVLLLLLRVLALLAAGAALAGIRWESSSASTLRLVVADVATAGDSVWRDSVQTALSAEDVLVDVHFARGVSADPGAALVAAMRRAAQLTNTHRALSQVELTVVLAPTALTNAGYTAWRTQWPGAARVVSRGAPGVDSLYAGRGTVTVTTSESDDVVAAAFATRAAQVDEAAPAIWIDRRAGDSLRVGGANAALKTIVVHWPSQGLPAGWVAMPTPDTIGALVSHGDVLVGPFVRRAVPGAVLAARLDSGAAAARPVRVLAWWADGRPAALEELLGRESAGAPMSCTRSVAVELPRGSDLLLSTAARGLLNVLAQPCGAERVTTAPLLSGNDPSAPTAAATAPAPAAAFRSAGGGQRSDPWWLAPALLASAVALLLAEWVLRNRETPS